MKPKPGELLTYLNPSTVTTTLSMYVQSSGTLRVKPHLLIIVRQIDPSIGKKLGFGGVILHGLCFYGIVSTCSETGVV